MIQEKDKNGEKYVTATTEAEFHEALNRGFAVELTRGTGGADRSAYERGRGHRGRDQRGAARPARLGRRRSIAKRSFWQRSEDYAKKVSNELIDQIKAGVAPW